jgi:hypothetical protein
MKILSVRNGLLLLGIFIFLPGCLDIYLTTQLFPNGEIEKTIVIKGDSTEFESAPFYFMKDSGWTRTLVPGDEGKKNLVLTKRFSNYKKLNEIMNPADTNIQVIRVQSHLKKRFRWFFTYFEYSETIMKADPYKTLDWRNYLTENEVRLLKISDEDQRKSDPDFNEQQYKEIEKRFGEFVIRSAYEDYYTRITKVMKTEPTLGESLIRINEKKEELYRFLVDSSNGESSDQLLASVGKFIGGPDLVFLQEKYPDTFRIFDEKMNLWDKVNANSYKFIIRMPGILLETSSDQIEGIESRWEFTGNDLYFDDVVLSCESRMINKWAFWVGGILLLLGVGFIFKPVSFKKS